MLTAPLTARLARWAHRAAALLDAIPRRLANRTALERMDEMDDDRLRDLGITRAQLRGALATRFGRDPMAALRDDARWGPRA